MWRSRYASWPGSRRHHHRFRRPTGHRSGLQLPCNEGDTIIVENPSFVGALNTLRSYYANLVGVAMDQDGINIEKLEEALKANSNTKLMYIIPNFQNPTGITMSYEKRKAVYAAGQKIRRHHLERTIPMANCVFVVKMCPPSKPWMRMGWSSTAAAFPRFSLPACGWDTWWRQQKSYGQDCSGQTVYRRAYDHP